MSRSVRDVAMKSNQDGAEPCKIRERDPLERAASAADLIQPARLRVRIGARIRDRNAGGVPGNGLFARSLDPGRGARSSHRASFGDSCRVPVSVGSGCRLRPITTLPAFAARDAAQPRRRIDGHAMPDGIEHRQVRDRVAVRVAVPQREAESRREAANGASLRFAAHVFAGEPAGPMAVANFQLGRADLDLSQETPRDNLGERLQSSADEKYAMPSRDVPGHALDSRRRKTRRTGCERICPVVRKRRTQAGEILFVADGRGARVAQAILCALRQPTENLSATHGIPPQQVADELPFKRR